MTFHPDYADRDKLLNTSCASSVFDSFELWTADKGKCCSAFAMPDKVSHSFSSLMGTAVFYRTRLHKIRFTECFNIAQKYNFMNQGLTIQV